MQRLLLSVLTIFLLPVLAWSSPPTRSFSYVVNTTIDPVKVSQNEDNIFNYLSVGVDKYFAGSIVNADISGSAAIADTKLAQITTAGKVSNTSLTGIIPITLLPVGTGTSQVLNYTLLNVGTGTGQVLQLNATGNVPYASIPGLDSSILTSGTIPTSRLGSGTANSTTFLRGDNTWTKAQQFQFFNTTGTFTAPSDTNFIMISMCGGGGGGGTGNAAYGGGGGGGAGGSCVFSIPCKVTPTSSYTVTVGAGGAGGAQTVGAGGNNGNAGGASQFIGDNYTISVPGGGGGTKGQSGGAGGVSGGNSTFPFYMNGGVGTAGATHNGGAGGVSSLWGLGGIGGTGNQENQVIGNGTSTMNLTMGGGGGGDNNQNCGFKGGDGGSGFVEIRW